MFSCYGSLFGRFVSLEFMDLSSLPDLWGNEWCAMLMGFTFSCIVWEKALFLNPHAKMVAGFIIGLALNLAHLFCKSIFVLPSLEWKQQCFNSRDVSWYLLDYVVCMSYTSENVAWLETWYFFSGGTRLSLRLACLIEWNRTFVQNGKVSICVSFFFINYKKVILYQVQS